MAASISVVIPNLDMAPLLADAIASVMRQDRPVAEIVVVDCGSTDGTRSLLARLANEGAPVRMIEAGPHAPGPARNIGIAAARGELIGFVDADDAWPEGRLAAQVGRLEDEPRLEVVGGFVLCCERIDPSTLAPDPAGRIEPPMFGVNIGAALFRAATLARLGGFDESFCYAEDVDLMLRVREQRIPFAILRRTTLFYRRTGQSMMSRDDPRKTADFRRAIARSLMRRRAAGDLAGDLPDFATYLDPRREETVLP